MCCNCITRVAVNDTIVVFDCGVVVNGDRRAASPRQGSAVVGLMSRQVGQGPGRLDSQPLPALRN